MLPRARVRDPAIEHQQSDPKHQPRASSPVPSVGASSNPVFHQLKKPRRCKRGFRFCNHFEFETIDNHFEFETID
jgi:hypothetical protein